MTTTPLKASLQPTRASHSTSSPRQMTMSAVAASTGSPNERRASASRSFSQSQDENTKLPDEMSPDLQKVRILFMFRVPSGPGKLLPPPPTAGSSNLAGPQTATKCNTLGTKIIAADCQLPVPTLLSMPPPIYQPRSLPNQHLFSNFRIAILFLQLNVLTRTLGRSLFSYSLRSIHACFVFKPIHI